MGSRVLVRVIIVLLAAILIFRIHQRVEAYRIPRENCREQMYGLARANVQHMLEHEGISAPDIDSLLSFAGLPDSTGVCPTLWGQSFTDSTYHFDPKLSLGTQFAISCPNHDRHGGVTGGLVEKDYPDSLFCEADWMPTFIRVSFPEYAHIRRTEVSRSVLVRVGEEQASHIYNRYPVSLRPTQVQNLGIDISAESDPLGGEYVFEILPDTVYTFWERPRASGRARGQSINIQTWRFVGYSTSNPDTSRVEIYFKHPLRFPSLAENALPGDRDMLTIIRYWDRSALGTLRVETREMDLLDQPTWEFLMANRENLEAVPAEN
ncbi:MAG: hypothetical protein R6V62_10150 [Candidatus Fermentibacteraceae bacterium]